MSMLVLAGALFIDSPDHPVGSYTLSQVQRNAWVARLKVVRVDADKGVVVYERVEAVSGKGWPERLRQDVRLDGRIPAGLETLAPGREALCFAWDRQFTLLVTYVGECWYTSFVVPGDPSWSRIHSLRPDLQCLFLGSAGDLAAVFKELLAGREAVVLCRKDKTGDAVQFVRFHPDRPKSRRAVAELDAAAAKLSAWPWPGARGALPELREALRHEDPLVRSVLERVIKALD